MVSDILIYTYNCNDHKYDYDNYIELSQSDLTCSNSEKVTFGDALAQ